MFSIRDEGELINQGFNFYPAGSNHIGFKFRIKNRFVGVRYSKVTNRFIFLSGKFSDNVDYEAELARILQEEIWREITAETGKTQQDLDNEIIAAIRKIAENQKKDSL